MIETLTYFKMILVYTFDKKFCFIKLLKSILIWSTICLGIAFIANIKTGNDIKSLILLFLLVLIPEVMLFIPYYNNDNNATLLIDYQKRIIRFTQKKRLINIPMSEIKSITYYLPTDLATKKNNMNLNPWSNYFYLTIKSNQEDKIIVTSLLLKGKLFSVKDIEPVRKIKLFPLLNNEI